MKVEHAEVADRLAATRWMPLLRLLDDADVDDGSPPKPDPAAVEPYRWLLTRVGAGPRLTQAGRPRLAVVEEAMRALGWDAGWSGRMIREDPDLSGSVSCASWPGACGCCVSNGECC